MNVGLQVAYLWYDIDALELRVTAEHTEFRGTADVYVGTGALLEGCAEDNLSLVEVVLRKSRQRGGCFDPDILAAQAASARRQREEEGENRRKLPATLKSETRNLAIERFSQLGLTQ